SGRGDARVAPAARRVLREVRARKIEIKRSKGRRAARERAARLRFTRRRAMCREPFLLSSRRMSPDPVLPGRPVMNVTRIASALALAFLLGGAALAQETTRVSVDSSGAQGDKGSSLAAISADGNVVAFRSFATNFVAGDANGNLDVFVHDRTTGTTECVSV